MVGCLKFYRPLEHSHISTFPFVQYFLSIHIIATILGTGYPLFGVEIFFSVSKVICKL